MSVYFLGQNHQMYEPQHRLKLCLHVGNSRLSVEKEHRLCALFRTAAIETKGTKNSTVF